MPRKHHAKPAKFTLIELLVVMTIISILAGLMLPALAKVRKYTLQVSCLSSQRQTGLAMTDYMMDHKSWSPGAMNPYPVSWAEVLFQNNYLPVPNWGQPYVAVCPVIRPQKAFKNGAHFLRCYGMRNYKYEYPNFRYAGMLLASNGMKYRESTSQLVMCFDSLQATGPSYYSQYAAPYGGDSFCPQHNRKGSVLFWDLHAKAEFARLNYFNVWGTMEEPYKHFTW